MGTGVPASASAQIPPAASLSAASRFKIDGPIRLTIVCAVLLSVVIAIGAFLFLFSLRNRILAEHERGLSNTALIVAKQMEQMFTTVESVQKNVIEKTAAFGIVDTEDRERQLSRHEFYLKLRDNAAGMPYVGSLTVINAQGRVINLSRQWPTPDIDVSDRDFFKALQSDPNSTSFISEPVRNYATGSWVFHFARKVSGPNREFFGLISAAIELQSLQDNFRKLNFDPNSSITIFREDGMLVARFPNLDSLIGRRFPNALALKLLSTADHGMGVTHDVIDSLIRIVASHRVGSYPISVNATSSIAVVLADWQRTAAYVIAISALSIVTIAAVAVLFIRLFKNHHALVKGRAQQEKAEQLREQNICFDVALKNMSQGLVMFDASTRIVVCNDRYVHMYGLNPEIVKRGLTFFELIKHRAEAGSLKDDPHEYYSKILNQIAKQQMTNELVETSDGRTICVVNKPMADGGWLATHEDVTDKVQAEIALRKSKESFSDLFEHSPDAIVLCDSRGAIKLANNEAHKIFGYDSGELINRSIEVLIPKDARKEHARLRGRYAQAPERWATGAAQNINGFRKDGSAFPADISINSINIAGEKMVCTTVRDVTERRDAEKRISYLAHNDSLTGLPNRTSYIEYFAATLNRVSKTGEQFAILSIDLDHFKEANDVYGHAVGDALLGEVARRLKAATGGAFLARVGGDEFVLIGTGGSQPAAAEALGERMLATFRDEFEANGHRLKLGLSIGGAVYPTDGTDAKTLMINADIALYRAKAEFRGSVLFFEATMGERLRERRDLQNDLRSAVGRGELFLHYQPQNKMAGETIGFEALVRWQCPKRGLVSPGTFIPIAEQSDLILPVGEWVLREACREAASWPQPLTIAVNISPIQFRHGNLPNLVHSILLETGLAPARLELEITEGVLIDDFSRAVSILRKLKSLGVQIAMDDFGSGYSSMSYLHAFPFDKIKIDRSFVGDLEHNHHSMAIVRAIIGLGHSIDVPILAEGVETEAQHVFLVQEGCDEVQGYLTGRPLPIEDYAELVGREANAKHNYPVAG